MPRLTRLSALRAIDPIAWERQIKSAMLETNGRISDAAEILEVSERSLFRWLAESMFKDVERAPSGVQRDGTVGRKPNPDGPKKRKSTPYIPSRRRVVTP
jgi:hypothetical protein